MAKKKPHLVCQHMEQIPAKALERYQFIIREYIRGRHGVYALYKRDKLYYVGLAGNLIGRLGRHLKDRHKGLWDRFSVYLTIENHHIKELESMVLRITKPKGNTQTGRFPKSQDLKKLFKKEVRILQREELDVLMGKRAAIARRRAARGRPARNSETVLGPYVTQRLHLRREYKGRLYRASVHRNGWVYFRGYLYRSPSIPASEICGRQANGWNFWRFERAPGDWVPLRKLRG
jgi:hypothetical protein